MFSIFETIQSITISLLYMYSPFSAGNIDLTFQQSSKWFDRQSNLNKMVQPRPGHCASDLVALNGW